MVNGIYTYLLFGAENGSDTDVTRVESDDCESLLHNYYRMQRNRAGYYSIERSYFDEQRSVERVFFQLWLMLFRLPLYYFCHRHGTNLTNERYCHCLNFYVIYTYATMFWTEKMFALVHWHHIANALKLAHIVKPTTLSITSKYFICSHLVFLFLSHN